MAIPEQVDVKDLGDYLEVMTQAVFQAGVSWAMVANKWPAFRKAFSDFDAQKVAKYKNTDIERLANDVSILRSRNKIEGTVQNAQVLVEIEKEFGDFRKYLKSKKDYLELSKDIRKRFKYMGEMNVYYFLFRVKEPVPAFDGWIGTIEGEHPRMREMVERVTKPENSPPTELVTKDAAKQSSKPTKQAVTKPAAKPTTQGTAKPAAKALAKPKASAKPKTAEKQKPK